MLECRDSVTATPSRRPVRPASALVFLMALLMAAGLAFREAAADTGARPSEPEQPGSQTVDARWLPWIGCWELLSDRVDQEETKDATDSYVCLTPRADEPGIGLSTLVDDEVILEETLIADGNQRSVDSGGCNGWQTANWSSDNHRIFVRSELDCDGGVARSFSGISLLAGRGYWLDIQLIAADDQRELVVRRYRRASASVAAAAGFAALPQESSLAAATARTAGSGALTIDDVIEASRQVDPEVVEAVLLETSAGFDVDAELLVRLADAGVQSGIIDLVVAISHPDVFVVDQGTPEDTEQPRRHGYTYPAGYGSYGGYGSYWAYGSSPYYLSPFGYGYHYLGSHQSIIGGSRFGGRVIKGRGYTRVRARDDGGSRGFFSRLLGGGGRGSGARGGGGGTISSGAKASPRGYSGGGRSAGRRAKPRSGSR